MKPVLLIATFILLSFSSCAQGSSQKNSKEQKVGGPCEGCEAIYETPIAFEQLSWTDTLPDFNEPGPKVVISGVVYGTDGKPAPGVILYVYHTDQNGHYSKKGGEKGWALRHGYIRGWLKTNEKGEYQFYTLRPASYPNSKIPQHIHPTIKEPNKNEYWIDEFLFDDDPFLTTEERNKQEGRGGKGIIRLEKKAGMLYGKRDIYLGRNIPAYPSS
jgi:protocatechuate 3,4-dioxygenase, beta subunit